MIEWHC